MLLISHRGNLNGSNPETENTIPQIEKALNLGFHVEIDLRYEAGGFWLGHDTAQHYIDWFLLKHIRGSERLWCHAKNVDALRKLLDLGIHCFWHQNDYYTLTSNGIVWAYPNHYCKGAVLVMPSKDFVDNLKEPIYGLCVDNPLDYQK